MSKTDTGRFPEQLVSCPYCASSDTVIFYAVSMPGILSACARDMARRVTVFDLVLRVCRGCGLGFSARPPSDEQLRSIYDNYLYISPFKGIGSTKYSGMIETVARWCGTEERIAEIGCSEGFLLKNLKERGYASLVGIEPGPQEATARQQGFRTMKRYYSRGLFAPGEVDVFLLMHVFEHFRDFERTLQTMLYQVSERGRLIIEVPDFAGFHIQHLFYYSLAFFRRLAQDHGLHISDWYAEHDALRVVLTRKIAGIRPRKKLAGSVRSVVERAQNAQTEFHGRLNTLNRFLGLSGGPVYWWGAGSVSVIYLNQLMRSGTGVPDIRVIDGDPGKQGCFIPGVGLEVKPCSRLAGTVLDRLVIASSLFREIRATMRTHAITARQCFVLER